MPYRITDTVEVFSGGNADHKHRTRESGARTNYIVSKKNNYI
jgi:hypothetical protein